MILYKAVDSARYPRRRLTSVFQGNYSHDSSWEDLICAAYGHIAQANQRRLRENRDYWFSATDDFATAYRYLNHPGYHFDAIAMLDLPHTLCSGRIFDPCLARYGYIEQDWTRTDAGRCLWRPNEDGVVAVLDMSSSATIYYLATYLWLKGNRSTPRAFRPVRAARCDHEFLILGQDIPMRLLSRSDADAFLRERPDLPHPRISDRNTRLLQHILALAPPSELRSRLFHEAEAHAASAQDAGPLRSNAATDHPAVAPGRGDETPLARLKAGDRVAAQFFGNAAYVFRKERAHRRFYDLPRQRGEDRDRLDPSEYAVVEDMSQVLPVTFDLILDAFINAGRCMGEVLPELPTQLHVLVSRLYASCGRLSRPTFRYALEANPYALKFGIYSSEWIDGIRRQ